MGNKDRIRHLEDAAGLKPAVKKTHVFFVLDSSGSMSNCAAAAIGNFNEQREALVQNHAKMGETTCSLILFGQSNHNGAPAPEYGGGLVHASLLHKSVHYMPRLTSTNYRPESMTPLWDAVGYAIEQARKIDDYGMDTAFLMVIYTDGFENASTRYDANQIKSLMDELRGTGRWTIQMMGANEMDMDKAKSAGFDDKTFTRYRATGKGMRAMSVAMASSIGNYATSRSVGAVALETLNVTDTEEPEEVETPDTE